MALPTMAAWIIGAAAVAGAATAGGVVLYTSGPFANDEGPPAQAAPSEGPVREVSTIAGAPAADTSGVTPRPPVDGPAFSAGLGEPNALAIGPNGEVYFTDFVNRRVGVLKDGVATTLAGTGTAGAQEGEPSSGRFLSPAGIASRGDGVLAVSDSPANRVRLIAVDGTVTTLAGGGETGLGSGSFADGKGEAARFNLPAGLAFDNEGNLLVADKDNHRIRSVTPDGMVSTFAGTGEEGSRDGPRLEATFAFPVGVAVAPDGSVYITEHGNHDIRRIRPDGVVETIYRSERPGAGGSSTAQLAYAAGIAVLADGSLAVANVQANNVLILTPDGVLVQVVGSGLAGHADGPPGAALFARPSGISAQGEMVLVADTGSGTIRQLEVTP